MKSFPTLPGVAAVLTLLGATLPGPSAPAATYYVRMTGSDSNAGTSPAAAFRKISKAANVMFPGDTVYVGAGTWSDTINPGRDATAASPIRFIADTDGSRTGDAGAVNTTGEFNVTRNYIEVVGFRIYNTGNDAVTFSGALGCILQDCEIYGNGNGVYVVSYSTATVRNCTIRNNSKCGIYINGGDPRTNVVAQRCRIQSNSEWGVSVKNASVTPTNCLITGHGKDGILVESDSDSRATLWNCTISGNAGDALYQKGGVVTVTNSALVYNGSFGFCRDGGTLTHTYNLIYGNVDGTYRNNSAGVGEIVASPQFNDHANGNYLFPKTSPLRDAGANAAGIVTDDLRGAARPTGRLQKWDIGCYELQYGEGGLMRGLRVLSAVEAQ